MNIEKRKYLKYSSKPRYNICFNMFQIKLQWLEFSIFLLNPQSWKKNVLEYESIFRQLCGSLICNIPHKLSVNYLCNNKEKYASLYKHVTYYVFFYLHKFHIIGKLIQLNLAHFYMPIQTTFYNIWSITIRQNMK